MSVAPRERILIVDDDPGMAQALRLHLEHEGFDVATAATGTMALQDAAARQASLVILDLRLPDMSGYEVCRGLRARYHPFDVPIVMLTGMDRPIDQLRGFAHGADAYLLKPYDAGELLATIRQLLEEGSPPR